MAVQHGSDLPIDPITIEVLRYKLDGIAEEMETTLLRSAFSTIVKEGLDASASLFTASGETLSQATSLPIHLSTLISVVESIRKRFPASEMAPGDLYLMNDPYLGGTHLPDIGVVMPIFCEGELVAFSATMSHHQDVGGMSPGSVPTNATDIYQEGLRLPPLRLRRAGEINDTLVEILKLNSRLPETVLGDLHAQIASCSVAEERIARLGAQFGGCRLAEMFATLLDRSERLTREALAALPEGTFGYVDWLDNDGVSDEPVRIEVAVTIRDGTLTADFTGSSPQVAGPFNAVPTGALAAAGFAIKAVAGDDIPTNGGCFRPVRLVLPEGSIVNPSEPAPVNARVATVKRLTGTILGALRQPMPDRIPADPAGELLILAFGGRRADGTPFVINDIITGGSGAHATGDGTDVIETDVSNCMNLPAEALEMDAPLRVRRIGLHAGSGGRGRWRGGLGTTREYEALVDGITVTHRGERHKFPANGAAGGEPGVLAHSAVIRRDGSVEKIPSKAIIRLQRGDRVSINTAGGGGYGPPDARSEKQLAEDLRNRKTMEATIEAANIEAANA